MTLTRKTPLKRAKPIRKPSRISLKHKADRAFSLYIRERDKACRVCGTEKDLQCAHLISRRYHSVRWDPDNAVTLCRRHHVFFTHRPLAWEDWIVDQFGFVFYRALRHKAQQRWNGVYPQ